MKREMHQSTHFRHQGVNYVSAISAGSSEIASVEHNREQDHWPNAVVDKAKDDSIVQEQTAASRCFEHCSVD